MTIDPLVPGEPMPDERDLLYKQDVAQALGDYDASMQNIGGCSDGYCCVTGKAKGMHTNGGCRCYSDKMTAQRVMLAARRLRDRLRELVPTV